MRRIGGALIAGSLLWGVPTSHAAPEELAEILRRAVEPRSIDGDTSLLHGLREMHDPGLRPLFGALAGSDNAALRREGILGLAQLDEPPVVNALMVAAIVDPVERANVLAHAYQEGLITPEQINDVLSWAGGDEAFEVLLRSWLLANTGDIDVARVETLAISSSPRVAALACTLLHHTGQRHRMSTFLASLDKIETEPERVNVIASVLTMIRADRLSGSAEIAAQLAKRPEVAKMDDMLPVRALLAASPGVGAQVWAELFEQDDSVGRRLRLAMAALTAWETAPASVYELLIECEQRELFPAIGRCGLALSTGQDPAPAMRELLALRHAVSALWIVNYTAEQSDETTRLLMTELIRVWSQRDAARFEDVAPIVTASERLAEVDPEAIRGLLDRARSQADDPLCQALLIGLSRSGTPPIWTPDEPWPSNRCQALALLIETRHAPGQLSPTQANALHDIAQGWGSLPDVYRLQAAWIGLRQDGRAQELLARVLAPDDI